MPRTRLLAGPALVCAGALVLTACQFSGGTTTVTGNDGTCTQISVPAVNLAAAPAAPTTLPGIGLAPCPTAPPTTTPPTSAPPTTQPPATTAPPTTTPPAAGTAAARYGWGPALPESDEFNYTGAPDTAKWDTADECWPGHDGNGRRCASKSTVQDGLLRQTGTAGGDTGWLASKRGQKFGRWEVRARSANTAPSNGRQYHPVLITWPVSDAWPSGAEYDYLENGAPGEQCAEAFLHYPNHQPRVQEHARKCGVDLSQWHAFGFEWTPAGLVGYIDGVEWFRHATDCIQCAPGPMRQTIQLDNFYGGGMTPAVFEVDWARVYPAP